MACRKLLFSVFSFIFIFTLGPCSLRAQDETPTKITDQNRSGDLPFSGTVGTDLEHVLIAGGNLVVNIPLLSVPGRAGLPFRFGIWYDNRFWTAAERTGVGANFQFWNMEKRFYLAPQTGLHGVWSATQHGLVSTSYQKDCGPRITGPSGSVGGVGSVIYIDSAGGKHPIEAGHEDGSCVDPPGNWSFSNVGPDTTGMGAFGDEASTTLADGTILTGGGLPVSPNDPPTCGGPCPITTAKAISTEVDSNGNMQGEFPGSLDTLGRSVLTQVQGSNSVQYKHKDSSGNDQVYTVNFQPITLSTAFNVIGSMGKTISEGGATRQLETSLKLPNGQFYTFTYDNYGSLTSLGLPTGGTIYYTWQNFSCGDATYRYVASRKVIANGQQSIWTFSQTLTPGATCGPSGSSPICTSQVSTSCSPPITVTMTDPLGNQSIYTVMEGNVTSAKIYQGSAATGTLLRQFTITYTNLNYPETRPALWLPTTTLTQLENGLVSEKDFQYDTLQYQLTECSDPSNCATSGPITFTKTTSRGNVTDIWEYDWGTPGSGTHGALLRHTHKDYLHDAKPAYAAVNIVSKVLDSIVYDGAGNKAAETDYEFDGSTPAATSGAPQHNYTNFSTANNVRGNATKVKHWRNTDGAFLATTLTYDDLGNIRSVQDPLGNKTSYAYTDSFANTACAPPANSQAWVSQVTNPLSQNIQVVRYPCTGLVQAHKDQNDINANRTGTTYTYDLMGRPLQKILVDGGQVSTAYNDVPPVSQTTTTKITSVLSLVSTTIQDGLGRATQSQVTSDPAGTDFADTTYDALGRKATVSNPYRTTSDPTYGVTTNQFDALNRVIQTIKQDGSVSQVKYGVATALAVNGDCTITTDEAGKQRGHCTDALGRLMEVDEPSPAGGPAQANYHAVLDSTGNFVLQNAANASVWSTGTGGTNASSIFIQDDGNLVLYIFKWSAGVYAAGSPGSFPASSCSIGTYLVSGQTLPSGKCIVSPHGQYFLYMSPDGNFYIYDWAHATGTWGPGTQGHPGAYATLQTDGNLVVFDVNGVVLWSSGTGGTLAERLNLEDDGRIIIYKSAWNSGSSTGQFNWSQLAHPGCDAGIGTGTTGVLGSGQCFVSPNGHFELLLQSDGNMVIYDLSVTPNAMLWSSKTTVSSVDPAVAMRTLYSYDVLGNLTCVEQHGTAASGTGCSAAPSSDATSPWRVRRFTYDSLSHLLTAKNPESGTVSYAYDDGGNLLQKTSPAPNQTGTATQTISYCYDGLNRVNGKAYSWQNCQNGQLPPGTAVVSYTYDAGTNGIGHMTRLSDKAGTGSYGFDVLGRLISETRTIAGISESIAYTYNFDGSVKTMMYPSGRILTYTPDSTGRVVSAVDGNGTSYVTSASYNPTGSINELFNGSTPALDTNFQYNPRLQLCRMTTLTAGTMPTSCTDTQKTGNVMDRGYDFHAGTRTAGSGTDNGNVMVITNYRDANRSQAFTYDALNRLTSGWSSANTGAFSWGENYSIDAWGNLQITPMQTKAHGGNFQLGGSLQNRPTGLSYDGAGNLMSYLSTFYTYDQENRLSSTAGMTYTYDGNGERVLKANTSTGAAMKRYWSMGGNTLAEGDGSGNLTAEYIYFGSRRVARIDLPAKSVHYYVTDHLGSTSIVASAAGSTEEESDYSPFGIETIVTGPGINEMKFTGKRRDAESGLDYFGARFDASILGRFMSADTGTMHLANPESLNRYSYVLNNPLKYVDPDGKDALPSTIVNTLTNFYSVVHQEMGTLAANYEGGKGMPPSSSAGLQQSIKGYAMFGSDRTYPMSSRYYEYEDQVEEYVAAQLIKQVQAWINDPKTTAEDLEAALTTLSGEDHQSDMPDSIGFFSEWIGRADSALKHMGMSGKRNRTLKALEKMTEEAEAAKRKEEEEKEKKRKQEEQCKKDNVLC